MAKEATWHWPSAYTVFTCTHIGTTGTQNSKASTFQKMRHWVSQPCQVNMLLGRPTLELQPALEERVPFPSTSPADLCVQDASTVPDDCTLILFWAISRRVWVPLISWTPFAFRKSLHFQVKPESHTLDRRIGRLNENWAGKTGDTGCFSSAPSSHRLGVHLSLRHQTGVKYWYSTIKHQCEF